MYQQFIIDILFDGIHVLSRHDFRWRISVDICPRDDMGRNFLGLKNVSEMNKGMV